MSEMRGQSAIEYMILFSTAMLILGAVTVAQMVNPATTAANDALYLSQARGAVDAITGAINTVYSNGPGAVKSVGFQMDTSWIIGIDNRWDRVWIVITTSRGIENIVENLRYDFENLFYASCSSGYWTAVVEWSESKSESLMVVNENRQIYLNIKPRGR
ncbi:MAG: hypothetical protein ACK4GQ_06380 [Candidatus Hadarchaeales archaeon]